MDLNYLGAIKIIHPIAKRMHNRKTQGRIVLIGDPLASHYAIPGITPYACSKAAVEQLAYQLKVELESIDIKVHYFLPPAMDTPLHEE
jgi:NAD(P)-dependent dehydrogenase (short-subunit alcohol dehydrogenase family)